MLLPKMAKGLVDIPLIPSGEADGFVLLEYSVSRAVPILLFHVFILLLVDTLSGFL